MRYTQFFANLLTLQLKEVKCICNSDSAEGHEYVQCEECGVWQHTECVNFDKDWDCSFYCGGCLSFAETESLTESAATLIVCPAPILKQWQDEIKKHLILDDISILVYDGVKSKMMFPQELARYDIVLTTYDVLRSDLNHIVEDNRYSLRFDKKYKQLPTPLTHVLWWRVCLDECQMV